MNWIVLAVFGALAAAAVIEGKLLLSAHEKIGDLRVVNAAQEAVLKQKEHDATLSNQLVTFQNNIEAAIDSVKGKETILRVPVNVACDHAPVFDAGADSVRRTREAGRAGLSPTGRLAPAPLSRP